MSIVKPNSKTLCCIGMEDGAVVQITNRRLRIVPNKRARWRWLTARPGALYAFTCGWKVLFIGRANGTLSNRLAKLNFPSDESNDEKILNSIGKLLSSKKEVRILVLSNDAHLSWGGFAVDLGAGLEKSLVTSFLPPWNQSRSGHFLTETEINGQSN
jgi:hypothetical protein